MIYEDIAGLLKTTAVVVRTGLAGVNSTWVFASWFWFVASFGAFFVALATGGYYLYRFFAQHLVGDWWDSANIGPLFDLVAYTCNFQFLWQICTGYYFIICSFIALFLAYKLTTFLSVNGPLVIQFFKNLIDWVFGEGL